MQYWWCKQHAFSIMILLLEHVTTCAYKPIALAYGLRTDDGYFIWQTLIWKNIVLEQKFRMLPTKEFYCNTGTTNLSCLSILYSLWNRLRDVVIFLGVCVYIIWFKRFMLYQHVITSRFNIFTYNKDVRNVVHNRNSNYLHVWKIKTRTRIFW